MFMVEIVYGKFLNNCFMQDKVCYYNKSVHLNLCRQVMINKSQTLLLRGINTLYITSTGTSP